MEIINPLVSQGRDIRRPLMSLVADSNKIFAMTGRMLLNLVQHLENHPGPAVVAYFNLSTMCLRAHSRGTRTAVRLAVDWPDFASLRDGLPQAHFRLRVMRSGVPLSEEMRTPDAKAAAEFIAGALTEPGG